jgi:DNA-directed RNA polymerase specialized sigma24 family protein
MSASDSALCDKDALAPDSQVSDLDGYIRTLDAIIELFPTHPEPMAAVELLFLEGCSVADLVERFGRSKSTIYRWIEEGTGHLKARLTRGS